MSYKRDRVAADVHEVGVWVLQSAHEGVTQRIEKRENRGFCDELHVQHRQNVLKNGEVHLVHEANAVQELRDVWVLLEIVRQCHIVGQVRGLFDCEAQLVVEVDITQLRVDSFKHHGDLCKVVVFYDQREALPQVAAPPSQAREAFVIVCVEKLLDGSAVV